MTDWKQNNLALPSKERAYCVASTFLSPEELTILNKGDAFDMGLEYERLFGEEYPDQLTVEYELNCLHEMRDAQVPGYLGAVAKLDAIARKIYESGDDGDALPVCDMPKMWG